MFEEGYFRPDYVTLEKQGVNAFSPLPRQADFYLEQADNLPEPAVPLKLAKVFYRWQKWQLLIILTLIWGETTTPNTNITAF